MGQHLKTRINSDVCRRSLLLILSLFLANDLLAQEPTAPEATLPEVGSVEAHGEALAIGPFASLHPEDARGHIDLELISLSELVSDPRVKRIDELNVLLSSDSLARNRKELARLQSVRQLILCCELSDYTADDALALHALHKLQTLVIRSGDRLTSSFVNELAYLPCQTIKISGGEIAPQVLDDLRELESLGKVVCYPIDPGRVGREQGLRYEMLVEIAENKLSEDPDFISRLIRSLADQGIDSGCLSNGLGSRLYVPECEMQRAKAVLESVSELPQNDD